MSIANCCTMPSSLTSSPRYDIIPTRTRVRYRPPQVETLQETVERRLATMHGKQEFKETQLQLKASSGSLFPKTSLGALCDDCTHVKLHTGPLVHWSTGPLYCTIARTHILPLFLSLALLLLISRSPSPSLVLPPILEGFAKF